MSDHRDRLVDLSTPEADEPARVAQVIAWLESRGWVLDDPDWLDDAPTYRLGEGLAAVVSGWQAFDAGEGTDVGVCTVCATPADGDEWMAALNDWFETGTEPFLTCTGCATTSLVGDLDNSAGVVCGRVALSLQQLDYTFVRDELLSQVRAELGGRWSYVHLHV